MTNVDLPTSSQTMYAEKDWQEEYQKEDFNAKPNPVGFQKDSPEADLHFIETDINEESPPVNQRHRSVSTRSRKNSPQEKASPSENKNVSSPDLEKSVASTVIHGNKCLNEGTEKITGITEYEPDVNKLFKPLHPQTKYSNSINKVYKSTNSQPSFIPTSSNSTRHENMAPMKHDHVNADDLSTSLNSALTFGDTQGIFKKIQADSNYKQTDESHNFQTETPPYLPKAPGQTETPAYLPKASGNSVQIKSMNPSEPSETDIFLHSHIRHEPPSSLHSLEYTNEPSATRRCESNNLFIQATSKPYSSQDMNSARCYTTHQIGDGEQHPVNGFGSVMPGGIQINGRDSSSSMSGSPLQNITPYGSLENEIITNVRAGIQASSQIANVPYPYHYSVVENNQETLNRQLQAIQVMNQNMPPGINSSVPPQIRGVMPVNPQVGQPQYCLPNSNIGVPPFQGQTIPPLLQHQIQQAQLQQMQMRRGYLPGILPYATMPHQQSQLAPGVVESDDNAIKEQENINNPSHQITQNHAQVLTQNQQHMLHFQNHPQIMSVQPQTNRLVESASPKQEELLQQHTLQGMKPQTAGKTKEELQIEYQNAILTLRRVQEQMQEQEVQAAAAVQVQSPVSLPQAQAPQSLWGGIPTSPTMPMAMNQLFSMQMLPQVHPHMIQQLQNPSILSPPMQNFPQNLNGLMNVGSEMNLESETMDQEPAQPSIEHNVGRGRGRLH